MDNMMKQALKGIVVLDLTRVLSGPFCTMYLGDMGADVIKIENPAGGDDTRAWGPRINDQSLYFASFNRNKRSVTLNLKTEKGKALFLELAKKADVVVENFRPGVMDKLGVGYETLKKVNPAIIYAAASGFGSKGPYASKPGYDVVAQAMGGIMQMTGPQDGKPYKVGTSVGDVSTGLNMVIGILAALHHRSQTGEGQYLEVALVNSVVSLVSVDTVQYHADGIDVGRIGNLNTLLSPFGAFSAADTEFIICCGNQKLFHQLCIEVLGRPELVNDERFKDMPARKENELLVKEIIEEWAMQRTAKENIAILEAHGIPTAPIMSIDQIFHDEHIAKVQGMFETVRHPVIGDMAVTTLPIKFSETKAVIEHAAPQLGEHTETVLHDLLGLDHTEVAGLAEEGVI